MLCLRRSKMGDFKVDGISSISDHFDTLAVGNHWSPPSEPTPVTMPIHPSSTYKLGTVENGKQLMEGKEGYLYTRWCNPTIHAACQTITKLEGGAGTLIFSSGMGAITTALMAVLKAGDHIIVPNIVYSGTKHLTESILPRFGIEVTYINEIDVECYRKAIKPNTKVLYGETVANPTLTVLDLEGFGKLRKSLPDVVAMVDGTFSSPYNHNALKYGIDVVIHSCTKYIGGHSDLVAGSITSATNKLHKIYHEHQKMFGSNSSPFDSYLILRGLKTLHLRMERHNKNGLAIAKHLAEHPKVKYVLYPGLESHKSHNLAKKQMRGFGGMISFDVHGGFEAAVKFVENLKMINLAVSLGGAESLVCLVSSAVHHDKYVSAADKGIGGITDSLIRLSVGLEHEDDIKKDIDQALSLIEQPTLT